MFGFSGIIKNMITLTYKYQLKPTSEQAIVFIHWLETCLKVWNYALRESKEWIQFRSFKYLELGVVETQCVLYREE